MGEIRSQGSLHLDTGTPSGLLTKWMCFVFDTGFLGWPGTGYAHQAACLWHKYKARTGSLSATQASDELLKLFCVRGNWL